MNFGKDVSTLKYFTICGLQEGYEPFAVNMNRDVTMWLSKRLPQFVPVPPNHQHIEVRGVTLNTLRTTGADLEKYSWRGKRAAGLYIYDDSFANNHTQ